MEKFCVFCGEKPENKNMEHVIPQWLIKLTGDPKRDINLGVQWDKDGHPIRSFPFKEFKVPACTTCNSEHGKLESEAQYITANLLENKSISVSELNTLLNWLDKIRIGLWIAFHYLDKNLFDINLKFHIAKRIGTDDRLLFIYKAKTAPMGVNFIGTNTPVFQHLPSCFLLRINNFFFFNASFQFLISRRIGFPFPEKLFATDAGMYAFDIKESRQRIMTPVIQWPFYNNCVEIYQPMFGNNGIKEQASDHYKAQYVKDNSLDFENDTGWPHWINGGKVLQFPENSCENWIQPKEEEFDSLVKKLSCQTFDFQNRLLDLTSYDKLSKEGRRSVKFQIARMKSLNNLLMKKSYELME